MRHFPSLRRPIAALALSLSTLGAGAVEPLQELVAQLATGVDATAFANAQGLLLLDRFGSRPIYRFRLAAPGDVEAVTAALAQRPEVVFAEPDFNGETPESTKNSVWFIGNSEAEYVEQWAPEAMRLAEAHQRATGQGVRIAVLDTGVEPTHPSLAGKLLRNAAGAVVGRDFVDDDTDPSEVGAIGDLGYGHGTHVAGLVALAAPGARIMPVRVLDASGGGNIWVLAEGIGWAVDPDGRPGTDDGAHVINLSLGTIRPTQLLETAVALATCNFGDDDDQFQDPGFNADRLRCRRGYAATVLASAGNSGSDSELIYPAAEGVKGSRAVAASTVDRRLADFSNRGGWIKLAAPGQSIVSAVPGATWGTWSGTSMAAPLAAGAAALVLSSRAPGAWRPNPRRWQPEDVLKRLEDRSAPLCGSSLKVIDALAAVSDTPAPDPVCP
jgi:subtilisin family serine protease